jgi:hypothetical protein
MERASNGTLQADNHKSKWCEQAPEQCASQPGMDVPCCTLGTWSHGGVGMWSWLTHCALRTAHQKPVHANTVCIIVFNKTQASIRVTQ